MPKPPMNDNIKLHQQKFDADGNPLLTRNGQSIRETIESKARVKYSVGRVFTANGEETETVLELSVPPTTPIYDGDEVEWIDRDGKKVLEQVLSIKEILSYNGKVVYFRKAWAGEPFSGMK